MPQRLPQVLGRDLFPSLPLALEPLTLLGESRCQPLHQLGDERIGIVYGTSWLVDEPHLDLPPPLLEPGAVPGRQQWRGLLALIPKAVASIPLVRA